MRVVILTVVLASVLSVDAKRSRGTQRDVCAALSDGQFVADAASCSKFFVCYNGTAVSQNCERGSYFNETDLHCLPDTNNICPQVECDVDGQFSPHESNCFSFYICYDGKLVEQNCDAGSYFDKQNLYCIPDTSNECIQPECSEDGDITAHPTNCSLFYVCFEGKLYEQSCGPGSYFDKVNRYCLPDNDNICPQPQCNGNGTFSPHPTDCALFYVCYDGLLIEQTCGNGSYFNKTDLSCLPDTDNICWTDIPTPEPCTCIGGYTDGEFIASPDSCYSYYVCSDGELVEQNCGYGNYFDNTTRRCQRDENSTCWPLSNSCPGGYEEGEKIGSNDSCYSYFLCNGGQLVAQSCEVGNYFDNCTKTCLCDTDGICWPTTPTPVPVPCECPGGYNEGDLIENSDSCSSYFICSQGELVAHSCGTGNYFDNNNKACVPDTNGICWPTTPTPVPVPCECPGGYNEGDLIENSNSCSSYFICSQGELVAHSCGTGNYFDNNNKACVPDTNGICWPTTPTPVPVPCECPGGYNEGDLVENSDSCSSYFICSQGDLVAHSCGTGNYFDNNNKACVPDTNGICWPTTPTPVPVPCECPGGYNEGDLIENSNSCSSYFICSQGELVAHSCGTGNYFDNNNKACVPDTNGICWPTTPTPVPVPCECPGGYNEGDLIENSNSCSSYFICSQGELVAHSCGTGNYFDNNNKACVPDTNGICWTTTPSPVPVPCECSGGYNEGDLVKNSDSCSSYFICSQGELVAHSCGTGNYFDNNNKACVPDTNGICWTTTPSPVPVPCECPGGYNEGDLVKNSDSCSSYFICSQGELVAHSCGTGNYFDSNSKTCVPDSNGICWPTTTTPAPSVTCQCDGGYNEGDLIANTDNCSSYFICTQGELVEDNCGSGYYFDSSSKTCLRDENGFCWATPKPLQCSGGYEEGDLVPNYDNCSAFYMCISGDLVAYSCEVDYYFNLTSNNCVLDINNVCWNSTCPGGYKDGELIPYPDSCFKYYICYKGELVEQSCKEGSYFDATSNNCVKDSAGICWSANTTVAPASCAGGYEDGELIPYPDSCSKYYICYKGELVEQSCKEGSYFAATSNKCVKDSAGICWSANKTVTPASYASGYEDGEVIPYPDSCYKYYVYYQGELIEQSCKEGSYFDATSSNCVKDSAGICWSANTTVTPALCAGGYEDGELIPYPDSCYKYYVCYKGELIEQSCKEGSYFGATSSNCVKDSAGICWSANTTVTPASCAGGYEEGELIPYPESCYKYYVCYKRELIEQSCKEGSYFDATSSNCVKDFAGICWSANTTVTPASCAGGYEDGELIPYPDSCYKYYVCYKGELIEQSCKEGSYFGATSSNCVKDSAGICWSANTTVTPASCAGGYEEGELIPYPESCYKYYVCYKRELIEQSCKEGSYFDATSSNCAKDSSGICWSANTTVTPASCAGGYEDGELIPYPDSCYKHYVCYQGELIEQSCKEGSYFDATSSNCVKDSAGICWSANTTVTPASCAGGYEDGELIPYPDSCYKYYVCYKRELIEQSCKEGSYFDATSSNCAKDSSGICWSANTTVTPASCAGGYEDGELIPYPDSCYKHYICYKGELIEQSCKEGSYFDATSSNCVKDSAGICWSANTTVTPASCAGGYEDGELIPYPERCYKYYVCYKGELIERSCKEGNYFDSATGTCFEDTTGICWPGSTSTSFTSTVTTPKTSTPTPKPITPTPTLTPTSSTSTSSTSETPPICPGGYDNGEFIADPNSCYKYNICFNGELIPAACDRGNYFDPASQNCVFDIKSECWPSTSSSSTSTVSTPKPTTPTPKPTTPTPKPTTPTPKPTTPTPTPTTPTPKPTTPTPTPTPTSSTSTSSTSETPPKCPGGYHNGEFIPDPNSCYKYNICFNGELIPAACDRGNYFDPASQNCVSDIKSECWPSTSSSSTSTVSTRKPTTPTPTPNHHRVK